MNSNDCVVNICSQNNTYTYIMPMLCRFRRFRSTHDHLFPHRAPSMPCKVRVCVANARDFRSRLRYFGWTTTTNGTTARMDGRNSTTLNTHWMSVGVKCREEVCWADRVMCKFIHTRKGEFYLSWRQTNIVLYLHIKYIVDFKLFLNQGTTPCLKYKQRSNIYKYLFAILFLWIWLLV